jgi:hypothetical protein
VFHDGRGVFIPDDHAMEAAGVFPDDRAAADVFPDDRAMEAAADAAPDGWLGSKKLMACHGTGGWGRVYPSRPPRRLPACDAPGPRLFGAHVGRVRGPSERPTRVGDPECLCVPRSPRVYAANIQI